MTPPYQPPQTTVGLPGIYYTDTDILARELSIIWHPTWQFVARDEDIPSPGDYVTCTLGKEPIIQC